MNFASPSTSPKHVAIVMDGNGRWATRRGLPRTAGHRAGANAVKAVVRAALHHHVPALTLYAFSTDNWRRPQLEITTLMQLFAQYLATQAEPLRERGVRLQIIGRRDRLPTELVAAIAATEAHTAAGEHLHLRLAIDYSARAAILARELIPDVDLLIRTGGEQRLSDFLLWECAYAELLFTPTLWPDFDEHDFAAALAEFAHRERRFGGLPRSLDPVARSG